MAKQDATMDFGGNEYKSLRPAPIVTPGVQHMTIQIDFSLSPEFACYRWIKGQFYLLDI